MDKPPILDLYLFALELLSESSGYPLTPKKDTPKPMPTTENLTMTLDNPPDGFKPEAVYRVPKEGEHFLSSRASSVAISDGTIKRSCLVLTPKVEDLLKRLDLKVGRIYKRDQADGTVSYMLIQTSTLALSVDVQRGCRVLTVPLSLDTTSLVSSRHYWSEISRVSTEAVGVFTQTELLLTSAECARYHLLRDLEVVIKANRQAIAKHQLNLEQAERDHKYHLWATTDG